MTNRILYIFPGQGSQYVGIGKDICASYPIANQIYENASEILGYDIKKIAFEDETKVNLTRYTQPILLTHSIACLEVFNELADNQVPAHYSAGHSLGEYCALVAAKVLSFEAALSLVATRGKLMSEFGTGEMSAFPMPLDEIKPVAEDFYCAVAGCNLPDQTVIGGSQSDLTALEEYVRENFPRKRFMRLKTEGAFHTYYMTNAALAFREKLNATEFAAPACHVLSNYSGTLHTESVDSIRVKLFYQLFSPVMWYNNLASVYALGVDKIIEFGGGIGAGENAEDKRPNLEGIIKKSLRNTDYKVDYYSAINTQRIEATAQALSGNN